MFCSETNFRYCMKILLTGANGYIGKKLLTSLIQAGHHVVCCVRDVEKFDVSSYPSSRVEVIRTDFLDPTSLAVIPDDIDAAYYLLHSMTYSMKDFEDLEERIAGNFKSRIQNTEAKQVIYLSGIVNEQYLSKHLESRKNVEEMLTSDSYELTVLRAGIIVGSGSASFEIIRDLVEKLPIMIAPKWLKTKSQPISVENVLEFLVGVLFNSRTFNKSFDIGGPDILSYKEMLHQYAGVRKLKRLIITVPVMTPRLSSYWLYFVTSTPYPLAVNLVDSMKVNVICEQNNLAADLDISLLNYKESILCALDVSHSQSVPEFGCFRDQRIMNVANPGKTMDKIWSIGGENGWYYADFLWKIRGIIDRVAGGKGLRRGRKDQTELTEGEHLDFWKVEVADRKAQKLLLFARMKLPGDAWLEFRIEESNLLVLTATFRPKGVFGRLYWYSVMPFHEIVFRGLVRKLAEG